MCEADYKTYLNQTFYSIKPPRVYIIYRPAGRPIVLKFGRYTQQQNILTHHVVGRSDDPGSVVVLVRVNPKCGIHNPSSFRYTKWAEMERGNSYVISVDTRESASILRHSFVISYSFISYLMLSSHLFFGLPFF